MTALGCCEDVDDAKVYAGEPYSGIRDATAPTQDSRHPGDDMGYRHRVLQI